MYKPAALALPVVGGIITLIFAFLFVYVEGSLNDVGTTLYEVEPVLFLAMIVTMMFGVMVYIAGMINYKVTRVLERLYPEHTKSRMSKRKKRIIFIMVMTVYAVILYYMAESGMFDNIIELFVPDDINIGGFTI